MKKIAIIITWIILIILFLVIVLFEYKTPQICCNNKCFKIEIANSDESRQIWLMHRESLWENDWMLFIFDEQWFYSFWMKNTLIPLAWIRINENMKIVDIIRMDPCKTEQCPSYKPQSEAKFVLEINQWLISEKWLLSVWDSCELINSKFKWITRIFKNKTK